MDFFIVENDPGIPIGEIDDPLAGLDVPVREELVAALAEERPERCGSVAVSLAKSEEDEDDQEETGWSDTPGPRKTMVEGKAVGSAMLRGDVATRDRQMRWQAKGNVQMHIRQAGRNAVRELTKIERSVRGRVGRLLEKWVVGTINHPALVRDSAAIWTEAYEKVRALGRKASGVERLAPRAQVTLDEEQWYRGALREELRYWNLFMDELRRQRRRGALNTPRMWERFAAYRRALRFMYESARVVALPDNVLLYWMGPKPTDPEQKRRICTGCTYMMERSPFPKDRLPAVPRDGSTPCLTNCRHRIVVRVVDPVDVRRRVRSLPERASMLTALKRLKEDAHGRWRQGAARQVARRLSRSSPAAANPFMGRRLPAKLRGYRGPKRADYRRGGSPPLTETEAAAWLDELREAAFDNPSFRHIDLYYVARLFAAEARKRPINRDKVAELADRLVAGLELTVLAVSGRADALNFSTILRRALKDILSAAREVSLKTEAVEVLVEMCGRERQFRA